MVITEVVVNDRTWWINSDQHGHVIAMAADRDVVARVDIAIARRRPLRIGEGRRQASPSTGEQGTVTRRPRPAG